MTDLALQLDTWLRTQPRWVPASEICERFGVTQRDLRRDGHRPGLLDTIAVSSTQPGRAGYMHHAHLPTADWLPIKHRMRRHAIGELRRVRAWDRGRRNVLTTTPDDHLIERSTGQLLFHQ